MKPRKATVKAMTAVVPRRGRGRPRKDAEEKLVNVTVRMHPGLRRAIKRQSRRQEPIGQAIRRLLGESVGFAQ